MARNPLIHDIDALLDELRRRHAILYDESGNGEIEAWSSCIKLPIALRRAIRKHRTELHALMSQCDVRVCCTRDLHRRFWYYCHASKRFRCGKCEELEPWVRNIDEQGAA